MNKDTETNKTNSEVDGNAPVIRTVNKAVEYMRSIDPDCQLTARLIRLAIKNGDFKARQIGGRYLVDVRKLMEFAACEEVDGRVKKEGEVGA